jgi:phenylacetate-CoA ligase
MIRYDTGDTCVFEAKNNDYSVLKKIYGRLFDMVFDTNGTAIHPFSFTFLKNYDEVIFWQFIQKDINEYEIKLKLSGELDLKDVKIQLSKIVGEDSKITIKMVDDIPLLPSGKRKPVICELKR